MARGEIFPNVKIGAGTVIEQGCSIGPETVIGYNNVIREAVSIGRHVYISHLCVIAKGTIIEDDVFIGPHVTFMNTKHIRHGRDPQFTGQSTPIVVKRGARIGGGCALMPGIVIGEEAMIGLGSVVTKDCQPYTVYFGNPVSALYGVPPGEWLINPRERTKNA